MPRRAVLRNDACTRPGRAAAQAFVWLPIEWSFLSLAVSVAAVMRPFESLALGSVLRAFSRG
jgi:hypothetical protein